MGSYILNSSRSPSKLNLFCYTIVAIVCLLVIATGIVRQVIDPTATTPTEASDLAAAEVMQSYPPELERSFGGYMVKTYRDEEQGTGYIVIERKGTVLYFAKGYRYYLGHFESAAEFDPLIAMGKDITGNGVPNLVISEWSGGTHCCTTYDVFELGDTFKHIATIDAGHGDMSHFEKLNGEKGLLFVAFERVFAYWRTTFADSPAPSVILRYCDNEYRLADNLIREPSPSPDNLQNMAQAIRMEQAWKSNSVPTLLWEKMLDLIYSGNASSANQLFDMAWRDVISGKEEFRHEFAKQLEESRYWPQIKMMNEGKPVCR